MIQIDPQNASPKPPEARELHPTGRPGVYPVLDQQQQWILIKSTEGLRSVRQGSARPSGTLGLEGDRSIYLPAEWGPRTRVTTLLGDSATTTRRAGTRLCAERIFSRSG